MKTCPRCKALLFDDMDTCYGCMYRFDMASAASSVAPEVAVSDWLEPPRSAASGAQLMNTGIGHTVQKQSKCPAPDVRHHNVIALQDYKRPSSSNPEVAAVPCGMLLVFEQEDARDTSSVHHQQGVQCGNSSAEALSENVDREEHVRRFPLYEGESVTIGRSQTNAIVLKALKVSRKHARVDVEADTVWLEDLNSANSTRIKGAPIKARTQLHFGDEFTICGTAFRLAGDDTVL